jgi:hypothetical protein
LTVEPASAVPLTLIEVELLGETGLVASAVGALGAIESWVKSTEDEQAEVFPAASVALTE